MLPNLIIIGAQKCGTTSLHYYLSLHPQIRMSREKELNFFIKERNWHKGIEWYKSNFTTKAKIYGESSPNYTNYPFFMGVPERMCSVVPEAKLIYIVRDPIDRITSHYVYNYANSHENRTIAEALAYFDNNPYVYRSKYCMHLEQYLKYFENTRILIITQEDLYTQRRKTLQEIFRFLDIDDSFYIQKFSNIRFNSSDLRRKNRIGLLLTRMPGMKIIERDPPGVRWHIERFLYFPFSQKIEKPTLDENLKQELIDYLRDDINRLRQFTDYNFENLCV